VKTGEYTSGTPVATISFPFGATVGVAKVTGFTSSVLVNIEVLDNFGATTATDEWAEGAWSDYRGHPKGIAIASGRLWNGRGDKAWGSGSDLYESQAAGDEDDDAISITLSVGSSSPEVLWLLALDRLQVGTSVSASDISPIKTGDGLITIGSSALEEALTPSNTTVRSQGATGIYVDQSGHTALEISRSAENTEYGTRSLMRLHKDIGRPGIRQLAFATRPDARLFMVRSDGQLLVKLFDRGENVFGWARRTTSGEVKSVAILPGADEDEVYVLVDRDGDTTPWQLEKLASFYRTTAADACHIDSYVKYDGVAATNISGADHLEGKTVKVWAAGAYMGTRTVVGGALDTPLATAKTPIVVGLSYTGRYQSSRLAIGAQAGTALAQIGKPVNIAFLLSNSTRMVRWGGTFDRMDPLPERGGDVTYDTGPGLADETTEFHPVPGSPSRDTRICLEVESPFPVTIQGFIISHQLSEKVKA
jgi:hypothetical protein